jgi:hypothetical protein
MPRNKLLCCVAAALGACATTVTLPPAGRSPVVEGLLLADSSTALFRIVWAAPPDGPPLPAEPVLPADVDLRLQASSGLPTRLTPLADSASYFRASIAIVRGGTYHLAGTIAGRAVAASTRIPTRFDITEPSADTLRLTGPGERRPFRWSASGAAAYYVRGARVLPAVAFNTRDTVGELLFDRPAVPPAASTLSLFAITAEAEAYLFDRATPRSNVRGAFGFLGGGIAVVRAVRWP